MAGCYHDKQDFKSDLNIEVARDADILEAGQDLDEIGCDKNPGHQGFIPFKDLTLEHLPHEIRNREMLDNIKQMGSRVVRLVVDKIKNGRQIRKVGSGWVTKCHNVYLIRTNNHVVKTEDEVKHCTVEFHYDSTDRSSVLTSRGEKLIGTCPYRDITYFMFHHVPDFLHQLDLKKLPDIVIMYKNNQIEFDEPIPIRGTSQLKFHSCFDLNSSLIDLMFLSWTDGTISYIKSFYFKFQPIPSNIQMFMSIEIHIDEDDGNSRVIPGYVVQFGDEFVVELLESIFQDEVKKCRLVWNGEIIGCGTRLYFPQVNSRGFFIGIDLELQIAIGRENYWLFEFHPIPRNIQHVLVTKHTYPVCCIGHPHGGVKIITFGRMLYISPERFDNQYRRIARFDKDCKCKVVNCVKYSCKTCPGSSGSPVFTLYEGIYLGTSFNHFMSQRVGRNDENINMSWTQLSSS